MKDWLNRILLGEMSLVDRFIGILSIGLILFFVIGLIFGERVKGVFKWPNPENKIKMKLFWNISIASIPTIILILYIIDHSFKLSRHIIANILTISIFSAIGLYYIIVCFVEYKIKNNKQ